jgi:hypothetical protein
MSGSGRGMLLSMQCCWSGSPPVRNGFLNAAGECGRAKRDLLRGGPTGGSEKVLPAGRGGRRRGRQGLVAAAEAAPAGLSARGCAPGWLPGRGGGRAGGWAPGWVPSPPPPPPARAAPHLTASACCWCWGPRPGCGRWTGSGSGCWRLSCPPALRRRGGQGQRGQGRGARGAAASGTQQAARKRRAPSPHRFPAARPPASRPRRRCHLHAPAACRGRLMWRTGDLAGDRLCWSSFWVAAGARRGVAGRVRRRAVQQAVAQTDEPGLSGAAPRAPSRAKRTPAPRRPPARPPPMS